MAMSRTSFMPARTLTRPEMASTADESCTWLTCSVFTASSTSLRIAAWSGGEEAMGKETKGKTGKWHQIRSGESAAASDAVEAAKQSEEALKTMAAAASADGASDASHIASIVDSVLADLRPKIFEEISRKMGKKK